MRCVQTYTRGQYARRHALRRKLLSALPSRRLGEAAEGRGGTTPTLAGRRYHRREGSRSNLSLPGAHVRSVARTTPALCLSPTSIVSFFVCFISRRDIMPEK
eukprot:364798-Chlamydomonas_euryale.AAC.3